MAAAPPHTLLKYSCVRPATSSIVTQRLSLPSVSIMLIGLWHITNSAFYLEKIAISLCDTYKIEGRAKLTVHTMG